MSGVLENEMSKNWLLKIENNQNKYHRLAHEIGAGSPCLQCGEKCPGLDLHFWRKICQNCKCKKDDHDINEEDCTEHFEILFGNNRSRVKQQKKVLEIKLQNVKNPREFLVKKLSLDWIPPNISSDIASEYLECLPSNKVPMSGSNGALYRRQQIQRQIPLHDFNPALCHELSPAEVNKMKSYTTDVRQNVVGQAQVVRTPISKWLTSSSNASGLIKSPNVCKLLGVNEKIIHQGRLNNSPTHSNKLKFGRNGVVSHEGPENTHENAYNKNMNTILDDSSGLNHNFDRNFGNYLEKSTELTLPLPMYSNLLKLVNNQNSLTRKAQNDDYLSLQSDNSSLINYVSVQDNKNTMQIQDGAYLPLKNKIGQMSLSENLPSGSHKVWECVPLKKSNKCNHSALNCKLCSSDTNQGHQPVCLECNVFRSKVCSKCIIPERPAIPEHNFYDSPLINDQNSSVLNPHQLKDINHGYLKLHDKKNPDSHCTNSCSEPHCSLNFRQINGDLNNYKQEISGSFLHDDRSVSQVDPLDGNGFSVLNMLSNDQNVAINECQNAHRKNDSAQDFSKNIESLPLLDVIMCQECNRTVEPGSVAVVVTKDTKFVWHPTCFVCSECKELLVDLLYFYKKGKVYCGRDFANVCGIPRCHACDELIFVKKYTQAEGHSFHLKHFCCSVCDELLADKNYTPINDLPVCLDCYDKMYAKICQMCKVAISATEAAVRLDDLTWHATCFACCHCKSSLSHQQFIISKNKLFCNKTCTTASVSLN